MLLGIHKFRIVFSLSQSPKIRSKTIDPINKKEKLTKKIFIVTKRFWVWIIKRIKAIISESNINRIIMFDSFTRNDMYLNMLNAKTFFKVIL